MYGKEKERDRFPDTTIDEKKGVIFYGVKMALYSGPKLKAACRWFHNHIESIFRLTEEKIKIREII
jgi:hypothetical protein